MKYALLIAVAALFAGPALAHPTSCPPPGTMIVQPYGDDLYIARKEDLKILGRFYPTPDCKPLLGREQALRETGAVESSLTDGRVHIELEPVVPVIVDKTEPRLLVSPPQPTTHITSGGTVTNNYYGEVYYDNSWLGSWSRSESSYYTPPFTLADLQTRCPSLDMTWAARALPYYATHYGFFQLWRMELNWNNWHDYEKACQIFSVPNKPIPLQ